MSISVSEDDLRTLSARAKRAHGGNVSAVVHELVEALRRLEAADEVLALLGAGRVRVTGEALAAVPRATCINALVMATAARRGGILFTSGVDDLTRLQAFFTSVRVLGV